MSAETLLFVEGLTKAYGDHVVLDNISTEVKRGEVIAIIGPSGCGKSTFLRSLNQLEKITSGCILFEGVDITGSSVDINNIRRKIGMVFQQFNLFPHMTIKENIMFAPVKLKEMKREEASKKAEELLKSGDSILDIYAGKQTKRYLTRNVLALSMFSAIVLAFCQGVPLFLQFGGYVDPALVMMPCSIMMSTGMWITFYREAEVYRNMDRYTSFI